MTARYNYSDNTLTKDSGEKINCFPECRQVFHEGWIYEEGVHYELRQVPCPYFDHIDDPVEYSDEAFPLVSVKSEDDPYEELLTMIARSSWDRNEIIAEAKKQFIVTKR